MKFFAFVSLFFVYFLSPSASQAASAFSATNIQIDQDQAEIHRPHFTKSISAKAGKIFSELFLVPENFAASLLQLSHSSKFNFTASFCSRNFFFHSGLSPPLLFA